MRLHDMPCLIDGLTFWPGSALRRDSPSRLRAFDGPRSGKRCPVAVTMLVGLKDRPVREKKP